MKDTDETTNLKKKLDSLDKGVLFNELSKRITDVEEQLLKVSDIEEKLEYIIEDITNSFPTFDEVLESIKIPEPVHGYTPVKGEDYFDGESYVLTEQDKKDIAKSINVPIVERETIVEKTETLLPIVTENVVEKAIYETPEEITKKVNIGKTLIKRERIEGLADFQKFTKEALLYTGISETRALELIKANPSNSSGGITALDVGTTAITSGTVGRVLFEGIGNVLQESSSLFYDQTKKFLAVGGTPTNKFQVIQEATGPGTISVTASSGTVTGIGTNFLDTFYTGQQITANGETQTVSTVGSNTSMTTTAWTNAASGVTYTVTSNGSRFNVAGNGNITGLIGNLNLNQPSVPTVSNANGINRSGGYDTFYSITGGGGGSTTFNPGTGTVVSGTGSNISFSAGPSGGVTSGNTTITAGQPGKFTLTTGGGGSLNGLSVATNGNGSSGGGFNVNLGGGSQVINVTGTGNAGNGGSGVFLSGGGSSANAGLIANGGSGGSFSFTSGSGGAASGGVTSRICGSGGAFNFTSGSGASGSGSGTVTATAGSGGNLNFTSGNGGFLIGLASGTTTSGNGGNINFTGGDAGNTTSIDSNGGQIYFLGGIKANGGTDGNIYLGQNAAGTKRGNVIASSLISSATAPVTSGTTKMVISDSNGLLSFAAIPSSSSGPTTYWSGQFNGSTTELGSKFDKIGSPTSSSQGMVISSTASAGTVVGVRAYPDPTLSGNIDITAGITFGVSGCQFNVGTDSEAFFGLGDMTGVGGGQNWTVSHIGFKVVRVSSGTVNVYATQADGTAETATIITTLSSSSFTDYFEFKLKVNSASVDYYWSKNGSVFSTATNLTGNFPTTVAGGDLTFLVGNVNVASDTGYRLAYAGYSR